MCYELFQSTMPFHRLVPTRVRCQDTVLECRFIADIIVDDGVILGLKALDCMSVIESQMGGGVGSIVECGSWSHSLAGWCMLRVGL